MTFSRFVVQEDQDLYFLSLRRALNSPLTQSRDLRLRHESGNVFHGRLEMLKARDEGVEVCHVTLSDVTQHKIAEDAQRENQRKQLLYENAERLTLAFDAGGLGAWDQDFRTGQIVSSSRTRSMLGFRANESITWPTLVDRIHPEDRPPFLQAADRSTQPGGDHLLAATFRTQPPEGAGRWLRFIARSYFDEVSGRAVRRTGVMADITREKETEALLESRARHLEALVRERTTRLQEAVIELEHFSYTLAHDLRAPLRIMIGFGELMLQESPVLSATHQQYVGRISTAAHRMDLLIRDALDYNKLVRQNFALEPIDPGTLLQQLVDTYPEFHEARTHISLSGPFPLVLGNSALLTQCFSNLLGNALKFIEPKRTPRVRLSAEDLGERVRIWIEDNGIGIPEDCVDRIFEMFHRLNPEFEGTGIGLALVKKAAHRMRGSVGVVSHLGHGSRFWIELDKAEQERPEQVEQMERS